MLDPATADPHERILHHALTMTHAYVRAQGRKFEVSWLAPGTREGRATLDEWGSRITIRTPVPDTPVALAIGLHECGHVLLGHLERSQRFVGQMDTPRLRAEIEAETERYTIPNEVEASRFALHTMRLHRLDPAEIGHAEDFAVEALVRVGADWGYARQQLVEVHLEDILTTEALDVAPRGL